MPFTANRDFKAHPRLITGAKGVYFTTHDGRQVLDGTSGLWCANAGHCRAKIVEAVKKQAETMDYAPGFQMGHPGSFRVATRVAAMLPGDIDHVFFCNSGSEAVDTALKIALAYHRARGEGHRNICLIPASAHGIHHHVHGLSDRTLVQRQLNLALQGIQTECPVDLGIAATGGDALLALREGQHLGRYQHDNCRQFPYPVWLLNRWRLTGRISGVHLDRYRRLGDELCRPSARL